MLKDHAMLTVEQPTCYANMSMYIRDVVIHDVWDIFMEFTGNPTYAARNSIPRERRDAIRGAAPQLAKMRAFGFPLFFGTRLNLPNARDW